MDLCLLRISIMSHKILVSNGEILDKFSILQIKQKNCTDAGQLYNINKEIAVLAPLFDNLVNTSDISNLYDELYLINNKLWQIEDNIRTKERLQTFDNEFIELARSVYRTNDIRATLKKQINLLSRSALTEEKIYEKYN